MADVKLIAITQAIDSTWNQESIIEYAGRLCYASTDKLGTNPLFISSRIKQGHETILEHCSAVFEISGISRSCSHQLVRHRIASYSQQSMRYCLVSNNECVIPDSIKENEYAFIYAIQHFKQAKKAYAIMLEQGIPKQDARFLLPIAITTKLIMSANFREWRHIIKLRTHKASQWEIREVATQILHILNEYAPSVFCDLMSTSRQEEG